MYISKVLFICRDTSVRQNDGGIMVVKRNLEFFHSLSSHLDVIYVPPVSNWQHIYNIVTFRGYGSTGDLDDKIRDKVKGEYDLVFFDGSFYGPYIKKFKSNGVKTYCFFHNIEYNFYKDKYKVSHSIIDFLIIQYVKYNEYMSVKYASRCIALNDRDSREMEKIYGRRADLLLPTSFDPVTIRQPWINDVPYCLFVGSDFFANVEGIIWFIKNVSPYIKLDVKIVGSICTTLEKIDLSIYTNVKLCGFVDDLDEVYFNATCVISPIFKGSGLKTKTIEALRYGRKIYGTVESFVGINLDNERAGGLCTTAKEFISQLNDCSDSKDDYINDYSLKVFQSFYTNDVAFKRLKQLVMSDF